MTFFPIVKDNYGKILLFSVVFLKNWGQHAPSPQYVDVKNRFTFAVLCAIIPLLLLYIERERLIFMKKVFALLFALALLPLVGCAGGASTADTPEDTTPLIPKKVDNYNYPTIQDKLTWDKINAFPVKSEDMTIEEMRELCVSFMRFSKTAVYTPNNNLSYERATSGTQDEMFKGTLYGGLPYIGRGGCGNVYRLMDYIDEETGVLDMEKIALRPNLFGGHCSSSTYWAWSRVISSVAHAYTANITHSNGYLRIGPYTYIDGISFSANYTSDQIVQQNGLDVMCKSYAELHLADGLVNYHEGGGHVIMASSEPTIAYKADGSIDPVNSYITILEQAQGWKEYTNAAGDVCQVKESVDKKRTFLELYNGAYMPFTFAEFLGTKPVEKTECSVNLSGEEVSSLKLFNAIVKSNFGISDIYISLFSNSGREVYRLITRATEAGVKELQVVQLADNTFTWGDLNALKGTYTVKLSAQLSTGERPELYTGKITLG